MKKPAEAPTTDRSRDKGGREMHAIPPPPSKVGQGGSDPKPSDTNTCTVEWSTREDRPRAQGAGERDDDVDEERALAPN